MTIATETRRAGPYSGNGSTQVFAFSFKCYAAADLVVVTTTSGVDTVKTLTTHYTVSLNANQNTNPGGSITMLTAPATGTTLVITSDQSYLQETSFVNAGAWLPEAVNDALDKQTIMHQQNRYDIDRSLRGAISDSAWDRLPAASVRAGGLLGFDAVTGQPEIADFGTVEALAADINTVAGIAAEIEIVAAADVDVATVADNIAAVTEVSDWIGGGGDAGDIEVIATGSTTARTLAGRFGDRPSILDYGAERDGVENDTSAWAAFVAAEVNSLGTVQSGNYLLSQIQPINGGSIVGDGANTTRFTRAADGNFINASTQQDLTIRGLTLDLGRSVNGWSGHGVSTIASDATFDDLRVLDFGSDLITGGGSGVLVVKPVSGSKPERVRLMNSNFVSDPTCDRSYGWIFSDVDFSFASNLYSRHSVGYAHELKNDSRFNVMTGLIGHDSDWCLAYGQETVGVDGCDMNAAAAIVAASCDGGYLIGEGFGNVLVGMVYRQTESPDREVEKNAVRYENGATQNVTVGVMSIGADVTQTIRHTAADQNYTSVAAHDGAGAVARFDGTSQGNFVDVLHPGATNSILGRIVYGDVTTLRGATANVVHSQASGERVGTLSGFFHDVVGTSGATYSTNHFWRYDSEQLAFHAFGIPGNNGDEAGLVVNIAGASRQGQFSYAKATSSANDFWLLRVGATDVMRFFSTVARPQADNTYDFGSTSFRYRRTHSVEFRPGAGAAIWTSGAGTPEGSVTAPVGSLYTDTSGGAGTTLYVKESGTGNTGWVAK